MQMAGVTAQADGGAFVGIGQTGVGARFLQTALGDADIVALLQALFDQAAQHGVVPLPPPLADFGTAARCLCLVEGLRHGDFAVERHLGDLAGGQQAEGQQGGGE